MVLFSTSRLISLCSQTDGTKRCHYACKCICVFLWKYSQGRQIALQCCHQRVPENILVSFMPALYSKSFVNLSSLCHHLTIRIPQILQGFYLNMLRNDIKTKATNKKGPPVRYCLFLCAMKDTWEIDETSEFVLLLLKVYADVKFYFKYMNLFFKDK